MLNNPVKLKTIRPLLIAGMLTVTAINADAAIFQYTDSFISPTGGEIAYIDMLTELGHGTIIEDYEDDVVWDASRSSIANPGSTPNVTSQGILWSSNFATNDIVTSDVGLSGSFGFYSVPHGDQTAETDPTVCDVGDPIPEQCFLHDGFVGTSAGAGTLYGVGGWIKGNYGAEVTVFLDGAQVDFGTDAFLNGWTFLGVIDTAGFNSFEFREINGKGEQVIFIYADDVTLGVSAVPVPAAVWLFVSGLLGLIGIGRCKKAA